MTRSRRPSLRLSRHSSNNSTRRASDARPPGQFEEIADKSSAVVDDDDIRLDNPMQSRREMHGTQTTAAAFCRGALSQSTEVSMHSKLLAIASAGVLMMAGTAAWAQ